MTTTFLFWKRRIFLKRRLATAALSLFLLTFLIDQAAFAQTAQPAANPPDAADENLPPHAATPNATAKEKADEAWTILTTALNDAKHLDHRVQALAALGLMGNNPRALKLIVEAMKDKDLDIRTAAVLAAGETKSKSVAVPLRTLLSDKEPQVAFAAATTLWKMKDHAGESVLIAVADGQRSANANLVNGTLHTVDKDLHDPTALAKMGALQGASMLLGPFGFGITAYEYIRKNGGDSARTRAIDDIAEVHTPAIRRKLIAALGDKDVTVRAAAAKGLRPYHDAQVGKALLQLLDDPKLPARLTAAAAYVVTSAAGSPAPASAPKKDAGK